MHEEHDILDIKIEQQDIISFPRTENDITNYCHNKKLMLYITKKLLRHIPLDDARKVLTYILTGNGTRGLYFTRNDITTSKMFYQYNKSKFDKDNNYIIKTEAYDVLRNKIYKCISYLYKQKMRYKDTAYDKDVDSNEEDDTVDEPYIINDEINYASYAKMIIDEEGDIDVKYDFEKNATISTTLNTHDTLQHIMLDVMSIGVKFVYPVEFVYYCQECETTSRSKAYEVGSNRNNGMVCPGVLNYTTPEGEPRSKLCKRYLLPMMNETVVRDGFFYEVNYEEGGKRSSMQAISFLDLRPGRYEAVVYNTPYVSTTILHIIDVKPPVTHKFTLPEQKSDVNYLFSLQLACDRYIKNKTGISIYGLYPIKCALILQTMAAVMNERLLFNVMVVGDPSTGKSMVLKYYPFLLNHYYNLSTNGLSISIPGLRGTRATTSLFGKDIKIVTMGHLGSYRSIHIDEAGENKELVQNLKAFLLEDNYSYDKAGTVGISNKRTAHVNLSQNLDYNHVGQYRGSVRKSYKDLNMSIDGKEKEEWDESWDLFIPLQNCDNPHLRKIIREKRQEMHQKNIFYIDGMEIALHERFPFYFFLVNDEDNEELRYVIKENVSRRTISENLEILKAMHTNDIDDFFSTLIIYRECEKDNDAFTELDGILSSYGYEKMDTRTRTFYYLILKMSRIINKRFFYEQMDFDLVKWYLETTNVKMDVTETAAYIIRGPKDKQIIQKQIEIEEEGKEVQNLFGLPSGDFGQSPHPNPSG